ncbi:MAG: hypothetical protein ACK4VW_10295 [Anaerolineales bacterium]
MSTNRDPSLPSPAEIRYAVKRAAFLLPEKERKALQALLRRKPIPEQQLLALFRETPAARQWLERALYWSSSEQTRGYEGLPGEPGEIPARSLWKCPQCDFTWRVLRKGRPVPPCPRHGLELEPALKERDDAG